MGLHLALEGGVVAAIVLDGLHAGGAGCGDVLFAVVDEEDVGGWGSESFSGVAVDLEFGLSESERVRPGMVIEGFDPGVTSAETCLHGVGHVGEDAGADAGAMQTLHPIDHGRIELAPEVDVGFDEVGELGRCKDDAGATGNLVPESLPFELSAIVGVAVSPVLAVKDVFGETGEGAHVLPGCGVRRGGEDHAVVEEDCFYWCHWDDCKGA